METEFAPVILECSHFLRRTGSHPRIKSEGMLRRKMLYRRDHSRSSSQPSTPASCRGERAAAEGDADGIAAGGIGADGIGADGA